MFNSKKTERIKEKENENFIKKPNKNYTKKATTKVHATSVRANNTDNVPDRTVEKTNSKRINMPKMNAGKLKVISLGGLSEIGKNLTVLEYGNDIILVDCGMGFPDEDMPGIDLVLPDISYLVKNSDRVRGVLITHGHEDHIGGLPYFLRQINVPVYGTKMSLGVLKGKLKEHRLLNSVKLNEVNAGSVVKLGCFKAEFIGVNHSIPDACALSITTPVGIVFHTGDFKLDANPIAGKMMDIARISEIGKQGVLLLLSESTNVERPGYSSGERTISSAIDDLFRHTKKRIIVATFSSNVHRVQQIIDAAIRNKRKVAISGRSMENILGVAMELGYAKVPKTSLISMDEIKNYPPEKLVLITTGSQGEPMSALSRMANSEHKKVQITPNDMILLSANPIPGNEKSVGGVINELFRKGAEVVYDRDIHVSGHACQEELKLMIRMLNPKFFMPIHGEYRHLKLHANLAEEMGIPNTNIFISDIGRVLEVMPTSARIVGSVPSGKVYVDGYGVGDVGNIVLRDRKHLAQDGLIVVVIGISSSEGIIVSGPDIISRGFVYVREAEDLMEQAHHCAEYALNKCLKNYVNDWNLLKTNVKDALSEFLYSKTKRSPMILPIVMEV